MLISVDKIQSMIIAKNSFRCKLTVYEQPVTQKMNCAYRLGVEVLSSRNLHLEVSKQTNKEARISRYLRDLIWTNKHVYIQKGSNIEIYWKTCSSLWKTPVETSRKKSMLRSVEEHYGSLEDAISTDPKLCNTKI